MTRLEEKLYLQSVFDAIDQVYHLKKPQQPISSYEERLRASFNKLLIPDWYNHEHASTNGLRKTKSHGHVPRAKRQNHNNNNNNYTNDDDTPDTSVSSSRNSPYLSNGQSYRRRSPSRSWSERPPPRRDSTTSSYDTNGSVINGRRSTTSNGTSASYTSGVQRVAQSSTWYKPRIFTPKTSNGNSNGHSIEPPKPLPRYSKIDQERVHSSNPSSSSSISSSSLPLKNETIRYLIKPRTMAQAQIPKEESILDVSSDGDATIVQQSPIYSRIGELPSSPSLLNTEKNSTDVTQIPRVNSVKSVSSDAGSYRSAILPSSDKNLLGTDSSSYSSVNERCLSPSTASYHTARAGDTSSSSSSMTDYETPTPQLDDDDEDNTTLSSHSSLSNFSHTEMLEPIAEVDLEVVAVSTAEQKSIIIPSLDIDMENLSAPLFSSAASSSSSVPQTPGKHGDSSTRGNSCSLESNNWYDGSMETCIPQNAPLTTTTSSSEIREISDADVLREVDINAAGDEFFLFSPQSETNDSQRSSNNNHRLVESPTQTSRRVFTMGEKNSNPLINFHFSSSNDPFGFDDNNNNNNNSTMITNLDDLSMNDDDDHTGAFFNQNSSRRPIQEDVLYEVEHENSFSDHSQNTSIIVPTNEQTSIKRHGGIDYLTTLDSPVKDDIPLTSVRSTTTTTDSNTLPIYILPPAYSTSVPTEPSSSLHIDTNENFQKWDPFMHQYDDPSSPFAYTSQIRHRQYSVGSYYDHKKSAVSVHPNHTYYVLGSAPVSPLSRASTNSSDSHYRHLSPITYDHASFNALRRVNPFLGSHSYSPSTSDYDYRARIDYRSSSLTREEKSRTITYASPKTASTPVESTITINQSEPPLPAASRSITSPHSTRKSFATFPQYEIPVFHSKSTQESPTSPTVARPPRSTLFNQASSPFGQGFTQKSRTSPPPSQQPSPPVVLPQASRTRVRTPSPPPVRTKPFIKQQHPHHIYQEIDSTSTDEEPTRTPNADLQFIRGAIDRVFHFNGQSTTDNTSDSSTYYEDAEQDQYPAVEAVQRFYNHKTSSDSEQKLPNEQITNLDDVVFSQPSVSKKEHVRSPLISAPRKERSKSSEYERTSSEEVDDTLNDTEDVDYQDENGRRYLKTAGSPQASDENSPLHSTGVSSASKKTSQETQTIGQQNVTRSTVPAIDIVTEMVIERDDVDDHGDVDAVEGDMVIFYDDIEIIEHSTSSYSSASDSESAQSPSQHYSKPVNTTLPQPPPPIPARTLKPIHLRDSNQQKEQQQQQQMPSTMNKAYELEKSTIRKKFDVNSVNDMLNRTDYNIGPSVTHRHPSARHFVGKLNNDDSSLSSTSTSTSITNGNQRTSTKTPFAALPPHTPLIVPPNEKPRSIIADTNALVKQIQNSLSRNSLHDTQLTSTNLSVSNKDLRNFVSSTYSPTDDHESVHTREQKPNNLDDQNFKRQARLSKSFHNVSEYNSIDTHPKPDNHLTPNSQPSKSVENHLDQVPRSTHVPLNLKSVVTSNSFSALPNADDNSRMLSMKWYTGQVSENSEICYQPQKHIDSEGLLAGYISAHSSRESQELFARLQASKDHRIHTALDDIRSRVAQFDQSKSREDLHVFMKYLESRLRDVNHKATAEKSVANEQQQADNVSVKSRTSSSGRQLGRQQLRSSGSIGGGGVTNGQQQQQTNPPRRPSQSSSNQENPAVFDDMLNTVLGLPRKGVPAYPTKPERSSPLVQTQITTNTTTMKKNGRDIGKRLFESGTYKDPRLIYDGPKKKEKEEQPLETSV